MTEAEKVKRPTLEKMQEVQKESQIIGEFLDYMSERDSVMCEPNKWNGVDNEDWDETTHEACYLPTKRTTEQMIALFFEIDLVEAEKERSALLEAVRKDNNGNREEESGCMYDHDHVAHPEDCEFHN